MTRTCTKCGIPKQIGHFGRRGNVKSGLMSWCKDCRRIDRTYYWRIKYRANPEHYRRYKRQYNRQRRLRVLAMYGGKCECCGTAHHEFLCVDHINNDGAAERRVLK